MSARTTSVYTAHATCGTGCPCVTRDARMASATSSPGGSFFATPHSAIGRIRMSDAFDCERSPVGPASSAGVPASMRLSAWIVVVPMSKTPSGLASGV